MNIDVSFFSIVIPTLNEEKYLPRLLTDLGKQTQKDFKIIIVDGHSDDKTVNLALSFQKVLPIQIINSPKRNVATQRNMGAKIATTPWIIFLDADDRLPKNFIKNLLPQIKNSNPDSFSTFIKPDSKDIKDKAIASTYNYIAYTLSLLSVPVAFGACIGIKTAVFNKLTGFNDKVVFQEDVELLNRLSKIGYSFTMFHEPFYTISFRRYRRVGHFKLITSSLPLQLQNILTQFNTVIDPKKYPMLGGTFYQSTAKPENFSFNTQKLRLAIRQLTNDQKRKIKTLLHNINNMKPL